MPKPPWKTSLAAATLLAVALVGAAAPAAAQGKGKADGNGKNKAKHYAVSSKKAITVSRTVLEKHGYDVVRVERAGATEVIYYRRGNNGRGKGKGPIEKLVFRTVRNQIVFEEAAPAILVDIDIKLGS